MASPEGRVALLALVSRVGVLMGMLFCDWAFSDLDSSARLQDRPCAASNVGNNTSGLPASSPTAHINLAVWDTVYFVRVAQCGYETDKISAFFPLLPAVMRGLGTATGLIRMLPASAAYTLVGLVVNIGAFCAAAVCLHRLGHRLLAENSHKAKASTRGSSTGTTTSTASTADLAVLFFCCNPASVFYSAAYSETLFAACTWAGLMLLPSNHWAGIAAFTAAAAARSNGILGVWFPLHKLLAAWRQQGHLAFNEAVRALLGCCAILAPYVAMQAQAYITHCLAVLPDSSSGDSIERPAWCAVRVPSVYAFIQREYWDVGFLRFYKEPSRLPMVLMSVPVACLSIGGCWAYFAADWRRALTLGLFSQRDKLPARLAAVEGLLHQCSGALQERTMRGGGSSRRGVFQRGASAALQRQAPGPLQVSSDAAPLLYHWALMTAVALLAMHVNVATRFLSACPPLYWHAAEWAQAGGMRSRLLWLWCFTYILLGCLLFPNFYPWC